MNGRHGGGCFGSVYTGRTKWVRSGAFSRAGVIIVFLVFALGGSHAFAVNQDPTIDLPAGPLTYTDVQCAEFQPVGAGVVFNDPDGSVEPDGSGDPGQNAELIIQVIDNAHDLDELTINMDGTGFAVDLFELTLNGEVPPPWIIGGGKAELRAKFKDGATVAEVQKIAENILWRNTAVAPEAQRTVKFSIYDGAGGYAEDTIVVRVTPTDKPPRNRTDIVMTQLDLAEVRHQYLVGPGWRIDRRPTQTFDNAVFDGDTRIRLVSDGTQNDYEGWSYDIGDATRVSVEMYVPSTWGITGKEVRAGLWVHGYTDQGERIEFPVVFVAQPDGAPAPNTVKFYLDPYVDKPLPADVKLDAWMTLTVILDNGDLQYFLTGTRTNGESFTLSTVKAGTGVTSLHQALLSTSFAPAGQSFTAYFDNLTWNSGTGDNQEWTPQETTAGKAVVIEGLMVAPGTPGEILTTVLTTGGGNLVPKSGSGASVSGSGTGRLTIQGTADQINEALSELTFYPGGDTEGRTEILAVTSNSQGESDTDTILVNVKAVPVPTMVSALNEMGLAVLILLLGFVGFRMVRRRA